MSFIVLIKHVQKKKSTYDTFLLGSGGILNRQKSQLAASQHKSTNHHPWILFQFHGDGLRLDITYSRSHTNPTRARTLALTTFRPPSPQMPARTTWPRAQGVRFTNNSNLCLLLSLLLHRHTWTMRSTVVFFTSAKITTKIVVK